MSRLDQYEITVTVDGVPIAEAWDKMTGGAIDSSETKYKPGAMAPQISLGGSVEVSNVTVERLYVLSRDHPLVPTLKAGVGKSVIVVTKQPLDVNGAKYGNPIVYTGKLKQLTLPEPDSESTSAALIQIEISTVGLVTA